MAIGRREVLSMYHRVGLKDLGLVVQAGAVNYHLMQTTMPEVHAALPGIRKMLDRIDLVVSDAYKTLPINMWSGGQITQVGLAVLLAVFKTARELSDATMDCIWLDEPFGPLDQESVNTVFESMVSLISGLSGSIKIISHKDLDSRLWDHKWSTEFLNGITSFRAD